MVFRSYMEGVLKRCSYSCVHPVTTQSLNDLKEIFDLFYDCYHCSVNEKIILVFLQYCLCIFLDARAVFPHVYTQQHHLVLTCLFSGLRAVTRSLRLDEANCRTNEPLWTSRSSNRWGWGPEPRTCSSKTWTLNPEPWTHTVHLWLLHVFTPTAVWVFAFVASGR